MDTTLNTILISVVLATHNGQRYLDQAIESVLKQSHKNLELLIVDDGSTDHTFLIAQKHRHLDNRVRILQQKNKGPGPARNYGISESHGKYIALIDDDDFWSDTNKLEKQCTFLKNNPDFVLVGSQTTDIVNEVGHLKRKFTLPPSDKAIRDSFLLKNCFITSSVLFTKDAFQKTTHFKNMRLAEDYDMWLQMGLLGKMANIDCGVCYRERRMSVSSQKKLEMYRTILTVIKRYKKKYPHYPVAVLKGYARILHFRLLKK